MPRRRDWRFFPLKNITQLVRALEESSGRRVQEDVPLAPFTSFHIGGPASMLAEADDVESLGALLRTADEQCVDTLILGGGTNLLVSDRGFDGLAVRLALDAMEIVPERGLSRVGASVSTSRLVEETTSLGLGGLEFAAGLPGTVGGGLCGNAGCFGSCLGDALTNAVVISPKGELIRVADPSWFGFEYRSSRIKDTSFAIAEATFSLSLADKEHLELKTREHIALRREKHPPKGSFTAGSYFKNLPPLEPGGMRRAAGWFLDQVGARELGVGDAHVFERHANIIVNRGRATAEDVLALAREMRRRVKERFDIDLLPEVRFVGILPEEP